MRSRPTRLRMGAVAGLLALVGAPAAWSQHNAPASAGKFKAELVRAYPDCRQPTLTTSNNFPACPLAPPAGACEFVLGVGRGQFELKVSGADVKVKAKIVGLGAGCEALTLTAVADISVTADDCNGTETCTVAVLPQQALADCTVAAGQCRIGTTLNSWHPGMLTPNAHTTIAIRRLGMQSSEGMVFEAGLLIP